MNPARLLCCLLLGFAVVGPAHGLWCNHQLVSIGDRKFEVRAKCGAPDDIDERVDYQVSGAYQSPLGIGPYRYYYSVPEIRYTPFKIVEEWTYNFGSHDFMQLLRFENGVLVDIRSLEWGY